MARAIARKAFFTSLFRQEYFNIAVIAQPIYGYSFGKEERTLYYATCDPNAKADL
jgi:hypothetical protein